MLPLTCAFAERTLIMWLLLEFLVLLLLKSFS
jgi:hypothetical protein